MQYIYSSETAGEDDTAGSCQEQLDSRVQLVLRQNYSNPAQGQGGVTYQHCCSICQTASCLEQPPVDVLITVHSSTTPSNVRMLRMLGIDYSKQGVAQTVLSLAKPCWSA